MAGTITEDFARIVALARTTLEDTTISQEIDLDRAILTIKGIYSPYQIYIKETINSRGRRYAYYILSGPRVIVGFDNHPDRQALRLKHGSEFAAHLTEFIPHRHGTDKSTLTLTTPWEAEQFLSQLDILISQIE